MPVSMVSKEAWISPPPRSGGVKVAVVYPNSYRVGMPNLGYQAILRTFLEDNRFDARRVFWDGRSLSFPDGGRTLADFDVVALSVSFQPDMVHLPRLLEAGRVGLEGSGSRPLLIGGGVAVTINPETCYHLFDLIVLGDAEPVLPVLKDQLLVQGPAKAVERDWDKASFLDSMGKVPGVYLPGRYDGQQVPGSPFLGPHPGPGAPSTIVTAAMSDLDDNPARPAVVSTDSEFGNLYPLEVSRGCPAGCLF